MNVYLIIDIGGYLFNSDDHDHWESVRSVAYSTKEKAHDVILREIIRGEFTNGYDEPIILQSNELPTIEDLESINGWAYECGPEYNGYKIQEVEVIE